MSGRAADRPVVAFVLSLIGGLFIIVGGIYGLVLTGSYYYGYSGVYILFGVLGLVCGVGVVFGAALVYVVPRQRVAWGVVIIVLGVASLFSFTGGMFGGFFIGMVLAILGGSLAIAWRPSTMGMEFENYRTCLTCGRHVRAEFPVCPYCGTRAANAGPRSFPPSPPSP
jgi:hypothetical protein